MGRIALRGRTQGGSGKDDGEESFDIASAYALLADLFGYTPETINALTWFEYTGLLDRHYHNLQKRASDNQPTDPDDPSFSEPKPSTMSKAEAEDLLDMSFIERIL